MPRTSKVLSASIGRITREDVERVLAQKSAKATAWHCFKWIWLKINREEKRVPMTRLRKRIAERLLEAKNNTAMLTTFNEVDMQPIMSLRKQYGEKFEKQHGVRLEHHRFIISIRGSLKTLSGSRYFYWRRRHFVSQLFWCEYCGFCTKLTVQSHRYCVNCDTLSMADIEKKLKRLPKKVVTEN